MDISLFLAQAFGLYFVIVGVAMLLQTSLMSDLINKFTSDRSSIVMGGFISLLIGVPLILVHNIWDGSWTVVVTVLVWITFIKGLVRVFLPDMVLEWSHSLKENQSLMKLLLLAMVVLGIYLIFVGFGVNL